eukprot:9680503-Alexandrium_andersonii.AAC.1
MPEDDCGELGGVTGGVVECKRGAAEAAHERTTLAEPQGGVHSVRGLGGLATASPASPPSERAEAPSCSQEGLE